MESIQSVEQLNCTGKQVIVRGDLDVKVDEHGQVKDDSRLKELIPTLQLLVQKGATKIALIGHRGRPEGFDESLSMAPIATYLKEHLFPEVAFIAHKPFELFFESFDEYSKDNNKVCVFDNLRFYKEEEDNNEMLAEQLSYLGQCYVNESFGVAHRDHVSVTGLPRLLRQKDHSCTAAGLHFLQEIENLSKIHNNPKRPLVILISGAKEDKLTFLPKLLEISDKVLIGGRLPEFMPEDQDHPKLLVARLIPDKEDITIHSMENFEQAVMTAGTVFVSGPVGKFEEEGHRLGTQRVFDAISKSSAFKIAGGGDTTTAIKTLKLEDSFDWISTGGGASLEFVANKTLPGIQVLA